MVIPRKIPVHLFILLPMTETMQNHCTMRIIRGSIVDVSQLQYTCWKAGGYGYKMLVLFWIEDIFSKENIHIWTNTDMSLSL